MEVSNIEISKLYLSDFNVRKTLTSEDDETGITDLANDIRVNGTV
jgi:hypothetical protein